MAIQGVRFLHLSRLAVCFLPLIQRTVTLIVLIPATRCLPPPFTAKLPAEARRLFLNDDGAQPSHEYTAAGSYIATLTVTDDEGDTHSDTMTVTVFQGTIDRANSDGLLANPVSSTPLTNPPMASIVYNVQPATDFTPTSVAIEIHDSEDIEDTLVKQFNLTASNDNSYTISWDGTNNAGVDVPVGHYDVRGIVTYTAGALSYSHTSKYHRVVVTRFQGVIDADNTDSRLLFLEDPPSESAGGTSGGSGTSGARGASGTSGARGTRSAPRATTQTTPTVTATGPRARITYNVLAGAGFTHSDVYVKIFSGDTEIKRIDGLTDSGGNVFTSSWDGTNSQGNRVSEGDYIVKGYVNYVNITGSTYEHESSPHTITVGTDFYPVASATVVTAEANLVVGETIQFDASASRDPDDDGLGTPNNGISAFHWDFGEGADPQTADTAQASCTYSSEGEKIATLTVIDNDGDPALNDGQGQPGNLAENPRAVTESVSVTVGQAVAILTRDPDNPDDITTNVAIVDTEYYSQIADADNTNTLVNRTRKAKIWYEISEARYGDFPRREITLEIGNDKNSDNDPILTFYLTPYNLGVRSTEWDGRFVVVPPENAPTHPYGLFYAHIRLKINRDSDAAWEFNYVSDPHDITVDAWPIANAGGDQTVYVGDTVTLDGSGSYDPDGNAIQTYTWDFDADDDDTTPVTVDTNPTSHAYGSAGSYTVELTVTDNEGRISPRISTMIVAVSEIGVSILNAGNSSVAIDTEYSHNNPNATDRSIPATIQYQLTAGSGDAIAELRFTLEIGNDEDPDTEPTTMVTKTVPVNAGQGLARTGSIDWDGKKIAAPLYGSHNAQIKLEVKLKNKVEWEQGVSRSGFHTINVASFPVADAGEDRVVDIDTTTNSVTVSFDGSNSSDPDDGTPQSVDDVITAWSWSFTGTDLTQDAGSDTATTKTVDTPYRSAGVKTATLTVRDNDTPALDDEDTAEITVIDVEIDNPTINEKLTLSNSKALTPPPPTISVQGSFLPTTIPGPHNLDWEITIGGNTFSTTTDSGGQGTISLSGPPPLNPIIFPSSNNDFGPNKVKLTATHNTVTVSREQPVILFFDKGAYENGTTFRDGTLTIYVPNWYVFWSQTKASHGTHRYAVSPPPGYPDVSGYYNPGDAHFYICNLAAESIDEFAKTCLHELEHKRHYDTWWSNPNLNYVDTDGDSIPDSVEMTMHGFDHTKADSNGDSNDDDEDLCWLEELKWSLQANAPGSTSRRAMAYEQDWSHGGEQWKRRYPSTP